MSNKLTVHLPYTGDEAVSNIERMLARQSYRKVFWRSFAPPHKIEYVLDGLSDEGVENWKAAFRETAKNHIEPQWLSICRFEVTQNDTKQP